MHKIDPNIAPLIISLFKIEYRDVKIGPVHARSVALVTDVSLIPKKNKEKCIPKKKPAIKTALSLGLLF